ncbi:MAG: diacylglycerol kinase family lipid kinase [Flavobacteriales bacterium]|nr:diacylglycerol kinase family lipid kinase [Flavobacteriales bacterium]
MERMMLIINPRSGKGLAPRERATAERIAQELGIALDVRTIDRPGHGKELAEEAVASGIERVISVGGDGTLNSIAAGLINTKVPVGVVALGSGNGYARSLGLPLKPEQALRHAFTGEPAQMDVCFLNDIPFLGTAGIGFDARVAHAFDKSKGRGMLGYARIIIKEILGAPPMRVVVKANHETTETNVLMLVFCNTREFGNGAEISPGSLPDDGWAELRIVRKPPFFSLIKAFMQIYTGKADKSSYIRSIVTRSATVWQEGTVAHLDGEPVEVGNEVHFRLEPKRIWVVR